MVPLNRRYSVDFELEGKMGQIDQKIKTTKYYTPPRPSLIVISADIYDQILQKHSQIYVSESRVLWQIADLIQLIPNMHIFWQNVILE